MISVIIPLYNAEKSIEKSLDSIKNQTWKGDFEIIIVNDGSTDNSKLIVENYILKNPELNISLINQENSGVSKARNTGLKLAKGEYLALQDADDEWYPQKTEIQMKILQNKKLKIDFLGCRRKNQKILYPFKVKQNNLAKITFRKLMIRNEVSPCTVIFKRKVLENSGYFDDDQKYGEDVYYWLKISKNNKMYILNEELVIAGLGKRTFGVSGLSANLTEMEKGFQKNLKENWHLKRIGFIEYIIYYIFYKLKYIFRLIRNEYFNILGK
ncbi:glycosyltransferase family 2 protein [Halpernia sp.]|uniref:glycosyltransferase family 2 protein n=1 Tax=Halpernia sp. TaxID=2782209 RepID=UPI003A933C08